jgi:hypothetical protein
MLQGLEKLDSLLNTSAGRLKVYPWTVGTGGFVNGKTPRWTRSFNLKRGVPFTLLLAGDKTVRSISCSVTNNATKKIEQRASGAADNFTFTYTPPADGSYHIQVGLDYEVRPLTFVCCAFLKPDGVAVDSAQFGAMAGMASAAVSIATSGPQSLKIPANFSFFNFGLVEPGKEVTYGPLNYRPSAVFAGTDVGRGGLALRMLGADRRSVIEEDTANDEIAVIALEAGVTGGFAQLSNRSGQRRLSFFAVVLN